MYSHTDHIEISIRSDWQTSTSVKCQHLVNSYFLQASDVPSLCTASNAACCCVPCVSGMVRSRDALDWSHL